MTAENGALATLVARQAILDCITRFCRGMDRFDRALSLSAFHKDAVCDYGPYCGPPEGLCDWAEQLRSDLISTHHHLSNHSCEISGDSAHAETYLLYSVNRRDGTIWEAHGRYLDRLECRDGEWRITMRYCIIESAGVVSRCEMPFAGIPEIHANGAPAHDRSDPSYNRPLVNRRPGRALGK